MKKIFWFVIIFIFWFVIIFMTMFGSVIAAPANPKPVRFIQPDGSVLTIHIKGDEKVHWHESIDNYTLMFNKNGYLTYAVRDINSNLQSSNVVATDVEQRDIKVNSLLAKTDKGLFYSKEQVSIMLQVWSAKKSSRDHSLGKGVIGSFKTICALVQFPEKSMVKTTNDFEGLINQINYSEGGRSGSVRDFFRESSYGQFDVLVKVAGPYTAPKSESYYTGPSGDGTLHCNELCSWLASAADADIDFSEFDSNNDGQVDGFHFIFAGYGQESGGGGSTIWSHSWGFPTLTLDGKQLSTYSCSPELQGNSGAAITHIGVIAHEVSHAFGSPDYYDVDYNTGGKYQGMGDWDIMSSGSWNNDGERPAHHNMYQKIQYGWVIPTVLSEGITISGMPSSVDSAVAYRVNTMTDNEYFILENRQQLKFDSYVSGHGLLIYRVHKDINKDSYTINTKHPQKLYPICASSTVAIPTNSASTYGAINSAGCPFPGSKGKTSFTDTTIPSMQSWDKTNSGKPITDITEKDMLISFKFMGGTISYPVIITPPTNGKLTVKKENEEVISGTNIENGTTLTISTEANDGYILKEIRVNNVVINESTIVVKGTTTISAIFEVIPTTYTVLVLPSEHGSIKVKNGTEEIVSGTNIEVGTHLTIEAKASEGYSLTAIKVNGEIISETTIVVNNAITISAEFEAIPITYSVFILSTENGTIKVNDGTTDIMTGAQIVERTILTVTATAIEGYELYTIMVNNSPIVGNSILVDQAITISAGFKLIKPNTFAITATAEQHGVIIPSGVITVNEGGEQTFIIKADENYIISSMLVDGKEVDAKEMYTFEHVMDNHDIRVSFGLKTTVDKLWNDDDIVIYSHNKTLHIDNFTNKEITIKVIDISGIVISTSKCADRSMIAIPYSGTYIVMLSYNEIIETRKVLIK